MDWRLGELEATFDSSRGTWRVAWSVSGERSVRLELTVPLAAPRA
ncbi:alpha-L-rhamnosidase C-terminal domain-containing protein [Olsenella intestinalis]